MDIPFHHPPIGDREIERVTSVLESGEIKGGGSFDRKCATFLEDQFGPVTAMMTTSCTHALEMAALLLKIGPEDSVVVPGYTFTATATAFERTGAQIEFCDVDEGTLNMDPESLRETIREDTAAIVPVHYAGVACAMDEIVAIAEEYDAAVVEDAAQALNATYRGEQIGTIGDMGCFSFHGTKSYVAGEGGAIFLNDESFVERAEYIRQKGTNYDQFRRGDVERYTWVDRGSSYVPSELQTALAYTQFERLEEIKDAQREVHATYHDGLEPLETDGAIQRPTIPECCDPNYHQYYLLVEDEQVRGDLVAVLREQGIGAARHYEPLHCSPYGRQFGYREGDLPVTESVASRIVRLPTHNAVGPEEAERVVKAISEFYRGSISRGSD